jgi:hypothetical protein
MNFCRIKTVPPGPSAPLKGGFAEKRLEFPVARDFLSLPPRLEFEAMLRRLEETMPWRSTRPGEPERRLAAKFDVEFVL